VEWVGVNEAQILRIVELLFRDKEESSKIELVETIIQLSKFVHP
jgi:hypothetical protein